MEKKEYRLEHYSKHVRKAIRRKRGDTSNIGVNIKCKKDMTWTFNRSPHGNKTAREQFGIQIWQLRLKLDDNEFNKMIKIMKEEKRYTNIKIISK